jgi:hypothetical protein
MSRYIIERNVSRKVKMISIVKRREYILRYLEIASFDLDQRGDQGTYKIIK